MATDGQEKTITRDYNGLRTVTRSRYSTSLGRWIVQEVKRILLSSKPNKANTKPKSRREADTDPYSDKLRYDL